MKRTILNLVCMIIMSLSTGVISAQIQEVEEDSVKINKWEVSANYVYGEFTDDYTKPIYENIGGFGIAVSRTVFKKWVGVGIYYKKMSKDEGTPYTYGYEDPDANTDIKISSWGPEVFVAPFKFVKVYARYGFLNIKENLYSEIGDVKVDLDGSSFDYGIRFNVKLYKGLSLIAGGELTTLKLDDMELEGMLDNWTANVGLAYKFGFGGKF